MAKETLERGRGVRLQRHGGNAVRRRVTHNEHNCVQNRKDQICFEKLSRVAEHRIVFATGLAGLASQLMSDSDSRNSEDEAHDEEQELVHPCMELELVS